MYHRQGGVNIPTRLRLTLCTFQKLSSYNASLHDNGVLNVEILLDATEADLIDMNIPKILARTILRKAKELAVSIASQSIEEPTMGIASPLPTTEPTENDDTAPLATSTGEPPIVILESVAQVAVQDDEAE